MELCWNSSAQKMGSRANIMRHRRTPYSAANAREYHGGRTSATAPTMPRRADSRTTRGGTRRYSRPPLHSATVPITCATAIEISAALYET